MAGSLEDLQKVLSDFPDDIYLKYMAAERFAEMREFEKALEEIDRVLKQKPQWVEAKILKGRIFEAKEDWPEAEKIFREVIRLDKENEVGHFKLAQILVNRQKFREAVTLLNGWIAKKPDSIVALVYIATIQSVYLKDLSAALVTYQKVLKLDPENVKIRQQAAQIYLQKGQGERALKELLELETRTPSDLALKLRIASIYQETGRLDLAIEKLQSILKINPQADRIHYFLGLIFKNKKQFHKAIAHFAQVPPPSSLYKDSVLHEVALYRHVGQMVDAKRVLQQAIQKMPEEAPFYQILSLLWEEENQLEEAVGVLKKGIKKIPKEEQLHFNLGILYDKLENRNEGVREMQKVIAINPKNASALNYIGYIYAERGEKLDEAESLIRKALELKPNDGYIIDSLGWVYFQKGDLEKALEYLEKAYKASPKEPTILEHLGDIFLKQGKKERALEFFKRALEMSKKRENPDPKEIQRVQEKVEQLHS